MTKEERALLIAIGDAVHQIGVLVVLSNGGGEPDGRWTWRHLEALKDTLRAVADAESKP